MNKFKKIMRKIDIKDIQFKPLEECCNILDSRRRPITKSLRESGEYPYYGANGIQDYVADYIFDGEFVLVGEDGSVVTENGNPIVTWAEGKIWVNNHAHIIQEVDGVLLRYLYHYIQTINVTDLIHGNIPKLNQGDFRKLQIAVPPLEVQREIVHILDDFMLLSAELSAELKARQKQYEYYKDKLFDFDKNIKVPLSEICSMERGGNFQKKHFTEDGIPAIHYGKIYTYYGLYTDKTLNFIDEEVAKKQKFAKNNDIIMAITSENVEDVCKCVVWEGKEQVAVSGHSIIIRHNQNARFLAYYFTSSHFQRQKEKYCIGTKVIEMKPDNLAKILVPIPSIEEQNRIVKILDKFYSIANDISEGLPAEIEARKKQYEYYRDKLLTFKELVNEG